MTGVPGGGSEWEEISQRDGQESDHVGPRWPL